jgi:hypothetical protein
LVFGRRLLVQKRERVVAVGRVANAMSETSTLVIAHHSLASKFPLS